MKKQKLNIAIYLMIVFLFCLSFNIFGQVPDENNGHLNKSNYESTMKNYLRSLNSPNHGVRMSAVEIIGRSKITYFEKTLIEMMEKEQNEKDKEMIALSLFQLGSFNSITALKNNLRVSNNLKYEKYLKNLLNKYNEYDKLRTDYFEDLVVSFYKAQ